MSQLNYVGATVQVPVKHWDKSVSPKRLVNADTLVYTVKPPIAAEQTFTLGTDDEVVTDGTGLYRLLYVSAEEGDHEVSIASTYGDVHGVTQLSFKVEPPNI